MCKERDGGCGGREGGRGGVWGMGQPMLLNAWVFCVLSLVHECEMKGSQVRLLIVTRLSLRICLNSAAVH